MTRTTLLWPCLNAITLTSPHLLLYYVFVVIIRKKDIVCHNVLLLLSAFFPILTPQLYDQPHQCGVINF